MNRVVNVCGISELGVHTSLPLASVNIESVSRLVEHFSKRANSMVTVDDANAILNATERLLAKPYADNWHDSLPLHCL